jgi:hypothetical protein
VSFEVCDSRVLELSEVHVECRSSGSKVKWVEDGELKGGEEAMDIYSRRY